MKKQSDIIGMTAAILLISPMIAAWLPQLEKTPLFGLSIVYWAGLVKSFRQVSITLLATVAITAIITVVIGYFSILWWFFGKTFRSILDVIESIPSILIALFCYAPVSVMLAKNPESSSAILSLMVFIFAAVITSLPEAVRGITLPLAELYHRKYSVSFRAYGFTKAGILLILLNSKAMRDALKRSCAAILLKTLVLDCSFGFIIQIGMGSYGTPAHMSPGALIAANRDAIFTAIERSGRSPIMFWLPSALLVMISLSLLIVLSNKKEATV
ncbi:MAG: hypothetical protein WCT14_16360 [Treponemataceae bacterium]